VASYQSKINKSKKIKSEDEELYFIIYKIIATFKNNKYSGVDLYDLYDNRIFHFINKIPFIIIRKIITKLVKNVILFLPEKIFNHKRNINPKAMGLILKSYCNLYNISNDQEYLENAKAIASWLIANKSKSVSNYSWGYPFNWYSKIFIPKDTPSSVVTSIVGDGFFSLYKITDKKIYMDVCVSICEFFMNDLNMDIIDNDNVCFSYTPIDNFHVNNANLFCAEFLIRIGKENSNRHYVNIGRKAVQYSISEQDEQGYILYWGNKNKNYMKYSFSNSDHYHSGYEIRLLYKIYILLKDNDIKNSYLRYYDYYKKYYYDNEVIMIKPNVKYPIDIHACSEAIICNSIVNKNTKQNKEETLKYVRWINEKMLTADYTYIYQIKSIFGITYKIRKNFHRWGQAWMLLALTEYLYKYQPDDSE
jgi:hypothetical protein